MGKALVIVESPTKAKTITRFLGKDFEVHACLGHIRALPSKQGSVDIANDFEPNYEILPQSKKYLKEISASLKRCDTVYLATDLDREGEAIAWHLLAALKLDGGSSPDAGSAKGKKILRITFHEITREAIDEAIKNPRSVSQNLVDAQQARVVLDYLVGFNLSPFLWKKIRYGLSAGRVQSVALRLICEREREIQGFTAEEYWSIKAKLSPSAGSEAEAFFAQLIQAEGEKLEKLSISTEQQAQAILKKLDGAAYRVDRVQKKEIKRTPSPPFTTSTLQQEAARKLGFHAKRTMSVAQRLYEGVETAKGSMGLITYMRTDSVHLAPSALKEMHEAIVQMYGSEFALAQPRMFKQKSKNVQEAHEAIRPTDFTLSPDSVQHFLKPDEFKLYDLIWKRALACQMAQAILDQTSVDILAKDNFVFRATGSTVRFPGFMQVYIEGKDEENGNGEGLLPALEEGQQLDLLELVPEQHFTQPPPRYTEASLVKALEEYGIGRPSTYASIISILQERDYVRLLKKRFHPEDIGLIVSDLLVNHFPKYVDYEFTSFLEDELDEIARGEITWKPVVKNFWEPFIALIQQKEDEVKKSDVTTEKTEETCPTCGKPLVIKLGRYGRFFACSGYPDCKYVKSLKVNGDASVPEPQPTDEKCELCGQPLLLKQGRYGAFFGCSAYPTCKYIRPLVKPVSLEIKCPQCGQGMVQEKRSRRGKVFYSCSTYPQCTFASWDKPLAEACPKCGSPYLVEKFSKRDGLIVKCPDKECKYKRHPETTDEK
jgi:DNA topoisomerase-1